MAKRVGFSNVWSITVVHNWRIRRASSRCTQGADTPAKLGMFNGRRSWVSQKSSVAAEAANSLLDGLYDPVSDVVVERVEGELVLLDLQRNEVFGLNEVGALLWDALSSGRPPREAVRSVTEMFEVDEQTVAGDVGELLAALLARGLVRRR